MYIRLIKIVQFLINLTRLIVICRFMYTCVFVSAAVRRIERKHPATLMKTRLS